ncbi:hypothetical protein [Pedobacter sp. NJ-S-72]
MNKAVEFNKAKPADSINSQVTSISGLIANGVAVVGKLMLGQPYAIYSPDDAKQLGIDAAYDATNSVVLSHHINEFYRGSEIGTKLYLMVVSQTLHLRWLLLIRTISTLRNLCLMRKAKSGKLLLLTMVFSLSRLLKL